MPAPVDPILVAQQAHAAIFLARIAADALSVFVLVRLLYYPRHRNKDFVFSFSLFNAINFLICHLLGNNTIEVGFAFGLFAIFSILRYRTVAVPIREMAYLLVSVTLGLINALTSLPSGWIELVVADAGLLALVAILDRDGTLPHENAIVILYDKPELLVPARNEELLADLRQRTGLQVHRAQVDRFDLVRDMARIRAFHYTTTTCGAALDGAGDGD